MASESNRPTVLVTGANSGIGLATVVELARRGFDVVGTARSEAKAEAIAAEAAAAEVTVRTDLLDVTDAEGCARVVDEHRPWGLVNNAGFTAMGAIEDVDDDEARDVLETMVIAPMRLARLALPHMRAAGGGRIVNVSSIYGFVSTPLSGWYQGAKHALEGLSDALRMELASDGIAVVLVEPGGLRTGIWEENEAAVARRGDSRYETSYRRTLDFTRRYDLLMGEPDDAARMIAGALEARSPRSRYLVGRDAWVIAAADRLAITPVKDRLTRFALGL
ncbi:MAG: SDR family NAD(P)-dependent oxidoreductase [Acidimicrobiia bacterium]|nr:SDR family NAD(P)-dependent oxidoreductase [Acidimicrobiia bacterium]